MSDEESVTSSVSLSRPRKASSSSSAGPNRSSDLCTPELVEQFVQLFYREVAQDELLGPVFNDVAKVDWATHIPKIATFWQRILFGTEGYSGDPFSAHSAIHAKSPFTVAHFDRWLELFAETLDQQWQGANVERMKQMAANVARGHYQQLSQEPFPEA